MARAREAIERRIAKPLNISIEQAAAAIYAVQNAQTGDLLRKVNGRAFVVDLLRGVAAGWNGH